MRSQSETEFEEKISHLVEEWDSLERSERQGEPKFCTNFLEKKKQDMKSKMCKFAAKDLGVGDGPYNQNIPESVNGLLKDRNNFCAVIMVKIILYKLNSLSVQILALCIVKTLC